MRILINLSNIRIGGGLQVAHSFLSEIGVNPSRHELVLVVSEILWGSLGNLSFDSNVEMLKYTVRAGASGALFGANRFLDRIVKDRGIEVAFTLFGPSYWRPKVFHVCGFAKPQYIYTDSPFFSRLSMVERLKLKVKAFLHQKDFINNNDVLVTENPDVSERLRSSTGKRVYTVSNTYNSVFNQDLPANKNHLHSPVFRIITVSANYPHKNLSIIPKVVNALVQRDLDWDFRFILSIDNLGGVNDKSIEKHLSYIGKQAIEKVPYLYLNADLMFLPTLLESFSASYAEAMKMQVPILTSDLGFARGICSDAAFYVDPLDADAIASAIIELHDNHGLRDKLIESGNSRLKDFETPASRAKHYLEIIESEYEANNSIL